MPGEEATGPFYGIVVDNMTRSAALLGVQGGSSFLFVQRIGNEMLVVPNIGVKG